MMKQKLLNAGLLSLLMIVSFSGWGQIISQYIETNSGTVPKGIEIWNNTASGLDFSTNNLIIQQGTNGAALADIAATTVASGTLASGAVLVIGTPEMGTYLSDQGLTSVTFVSYSFTFNGDDALAVKYGGNITDIFGTPGSDPGSAWTGNGVSTANQNIALIPGITSGASAWTDPSLRFTTISTTPSTLPAGLEGFGIAPESASTPTISATPASLSGFTYVVNNGPSVSQSYGLSASNLTPASGNITITPPANYEISLNNSTFGQVPLVVAYSASALTSTSVYVRLKAGLAGGTYNGEIIANAGGGATTTNVICNGIVEEPASTTLPYQEDFSSGFGLCYTYSVSGPDQYWKHNSSGEYAYMNGYNTGLLEEDWMILPAVNFNNYTNASMSFDSYMNFGSDNADNYFKLVYSTNYAGIGDPTLATWTELSFDYPTDLSTWTPSGTVSLSAITGTSVYIAFKYHYNSTFYRSWQVDNISIVPDISPALSVTPASLTGFFYTEGNGPSLAQTYTLSGVNLVGSGNIIVAAPTNYEISLNGTTYSATLNVPYAAGTITNQPMTISVRLKAGLTSGTFNDEIISHIGGGAPAVDVTCNGTVQFVNFASIPYTEDFADDLGLCTPLSVSGDTKEWEHNSIFGTASMSGLISGELEEDWLILPGINLLTNTNIGLNFDSWRRYGIDNENNYLKLLYSTDYPGVGDPNAYTWTELAFSAPVADLSWTPSGIVDLSAISNQAVFIAFKYHYNDGFYRSWQIDNIEIAEMVVPGTLAVTPGSLSGFTYMEGNGPSAEQSFVVSGQNLTEGISIAASANYEISTVSGESFVATNLVVLPQTGGNVASTTVYVRLKAGLAAGSYSGEQLLVTSADAANKVVTLNGSVTTPGSGGLLLVDNFEYTIGSNLVDNGWEAHSGAGTESPTVTNGLSFEGYAGNDIGGAALLDNNGEDIHRNFEEQTTGAVYAAFILNPTGNATAGYFIHFGQTTLGTTFFTRVWLNASGDGLGIGQSAPETYVPITAGQPLLGVMKFDFATSTSSLYVFNSFPAAEPALADAEFIETASFSNIGSIALRQFNAAENIVVDGIRVATTWADAVAPSGGTPVVASPTFNPPAGNYLNPIEVTISSSTADATLYYSETSATGPWTVYTTPVNVASATTIWAYGEKDGYTDSPVVSASYTFNQATPVATIAELRQGSTDGTVYQLTGEAILTFQASTRNQKFIQDATAGILIDDSPGIITTAYNLYDGITGITGTLTIYQNMLEFIPTADPGAASSTGNTVTPVEVALSDLDDSYQAQLVKVLFVDFVADGNFAASTNYDITDPTGSGVFRTQYSGLNYIGTPIPTELQDITGVIMQYSSTMQLIARSLDDFTNSSTTDPMITVNPASLSGFTYVEDNGPSAEQSFMVSGQNLTTGISIAASANYEISTGSSGSFVATNPVVLPQTGGNVASTTVYVRLKAGLAAGSYSGEQLIATSAGAANQVVTLNGSVTTQGSGGLLLVDNFEYTIGSNLVDNGWEAHSGAGTESPTVTDGLSFEGYAGTDIGGAALLDNNGEDVHRNFEEQTAGAVYAAFVLNPTGNATAGYFIHFGQTTLGTTFFTRVWLNASGDGLGIGQSAPETYVPITAGQPLLGVMKFDFATSTSSLYVFNSFPAAEPALADAEFIETASFSNIGSIALRQFNAAENIVVDGIRVATTWADAVAPSGGTPVVASPTFNPPAGNYLNPIEVTISSSTADATLYYSETSATGPWTVYTTPVNVASATTIWAYGEKDGYTDSPVVSASYTFNQATPVATIAELRQGSTDGTVYQLTGEAILTFQASTRNQKFIQDATAGILIDDSPGIITTAYNLYDGITGITGTLMLYQNMLEFIPTADPGAASSTGNTVTPVEVALNDLDDSYQAQLVKVLFVDFVADGNFAASTNYDITDPTGSGVFRTQYASLDYIGTPIPTELQDITGVIMQYSSAMQLVARSLDDFTNSSTTDPTITVNPTSLSGFAYIEGNGPSAIQTYALSGTNLEGTGNITVTAPADYEVSSDGSTFGETLSYPFASGTITGQPITVSVRLKAGLSVGDYNAETIVNSGGGATDKVVTCNGSITLQGEPALADVTLPMFIQGLNGTNNSRVPFAYRASLTNLLPNATYRFYNKIVVEGDAVDYNGAGNCIFIGVDGTFSRTSSTSLGTPGEYGEFTTDATGSFTGWFITEPTGNARFTPGNALYMRFSLNDGNEGTVVATRLTTDDFTTVLQFGTEADPTHGTAIRGVSEDSPKNMVYLYDNVDGTGRPLYGTHIESTEVDFAGLTSYAPFYISEVAGVNGSWGGIVPNMNAAGVQRVEVRNVTDGSIEHTYSVASGVWIETDTRNPNGGVDGVLVLDLISINVNNPAMKDVKIYSTSGVLNIETLKADRFEFTLINLQGQQVISRQLAGSSHYAVPVNVPAGIYLVKLAGAEGIVTAKVFVR
ncbi:MAG: DUF5689 domain-containing protein [Lentimicrobium sp.]|jgi:hypothetical protein|nr:DUF5689 domain-containing protein [Lentimicrobium sp.]